MMNNKNLLVIPKLHPICRSKICILYLICVNYELCLLSIFIVIYSVTIVRQFNGIFISILGTNTQQFRELSRWGGEGTSNWTQNQVHARQTHLPVSCIAACCVSARDSLSLMSFYRSTWVTKKTLMTSPTNTYKDMSYRPFMSHQSDCPKTFDPVGTRSINRFTFFIL